MDLYILIKNIILYNYSDFMMTKQYFITYI